MSRHTEPLRSPSTCSSPARCLALVVLAAACVSPFNPTVAPRDAVDVDESPLVDRLSADLPDAYSSDLADISAPDHVDASVVDVVDVVDVVASDFVDVVDASAPDLVDASAPDVVDASAPDIVDASAPDIVDVVAVIDVVANDINDVGGADVTDASAPDACPSGQTFCAGVCRDLSTDPMNCGACGAACAVGRTCASSTCRCPTGLTECSGVCRDLVRSGAHCGMCARACATACARAACDTVIQVVAGGSMSCALLMGGEVRCATRGTQGFVPVPGISGAVQIAVGPRFACYRNAGGAVFCWGESAAGLGDGTSTTSATPVRVNLGTGSAAQVAVSAWSDTACVVLIDRTVRCWGDGTAGMLGDGRRVSSATPVTVTGLSFADEVALGRAHACARGNGEIRCWGQNGLGQLGDDSTTERLTPVRPASGGSALITTAVQIVTGAYHTCALMAEAYVKCWGQNDRGNLCVRDTSGRTAPVGAQLDQTVRQISASGAHTCARSLDGSVRCWGDGSTGAMGNDTRAEVNSGPVFPTGIGGVSMVSAGARHTCVLLMDGRVRCWGDNSEGQLGDGTLADRLTSALAVWP